MKINKYLIFGGIVKQSPLSRKKKKKVLFHRVQNWKHLIKKKTVKINKQKKRENLGSSAIYLFCRSSKVRNKFRKINWKYRERRRTCNKEEKNSKQNHKSITYSQLPFNFFLYLHNNSLTLLIIMLSPIQICIKLQFYWLFILYIQIFFFPPISSSA